MSRLWIRVNGAGKISSSPSSMPPWGTSKVSEEHRARYEAQGWQEVEEASLAGLEYDLPLPPAAERIALLYEKYDTNRLRLERYLGDAANYVKDNAYAEEIRAQITALDDEYIANVGVILSG